MFAQKQGVEYTTKKLLAGHWRLQPGALLTFELLHLEGRERQRIGQPEVQFSLANVLATVRYVWCVFLETF